MSKPNELPASNRRHFIKTTGSVTAASALAGVAIPRVHSDVDDMTQIAVVGAGGRGTGAADNALSVPSDIARNKLVAMADVSSAMIDNTRTMWTCRPIAATSVLTAMPRRWIT